MLTQREHDALARWYSQQEILDETERLIRAQDWERLEEHLHMRCLFALSRHHELTVREDLDVTEFAAVPPGWLAGLA